MKTNKHWKKIERAFDEWYADPISDPDVIKKIIKTAFSQREEEGKSWLIKKVRVKQK